MIDALLFFFALVDCIDVNTVFNALGGQYSHEEIVYSMDSLWSTGRVMEDSILWNPDTMGNGYGYDTNGVWHN